MSSSGRFYRILCFRPSKLLVRPCETNRNQQISINVKPETTITSCIFVTRFSKVYEQFYCIKFFFCNCRICRKVKDLIFRRRKDFLNSTEIHKGCKLNFTISNAYWIFVYYFYLRRRDQENIEALIEFRF